MTTTSSRRMAAIAGGLALAAGSWLGMATPALAAAQGTVEGSGESVNLRAGPSTHDAITGSEPDQASVTIGCTSRGETVQGNWGATNLWDRLDNGSYI